MNVIDEQDSGPTTYAKVGSKILRLFYLYSNIIALFNFFFVLKNLNLTARSEVSIDARKKISTAVFKLPAHLFSILKNKFILLLSIDN